MKRKIALLLAIAMILSMIPANLFADPAPTAGRAGPAVNVFTGSYHRQPGAPAQFTLSHADALMLMGPAVLTAQALRIELTDASFVLQTPMAWVASGPGANHGGALPSTPTASPLPSDVGFGALAPAGQTFNLPNATVTVPLHMIPERTETVNWEVTWTGATGAGTAEMFVAAGGRAYITLPHGLSPGSLDGDILFDLPFDVRINNANAFMRVFHGVTAGNLVAQGPLFTGAGAGGVQITYGDVVYFDYDAHLSNFTFRETGQPGNLVPVGTAPQQLVFRLTAPAHYTWNNYDNDDLLYIAGGRATATLVQADTFWLTGNRSELVIVVNVTRAAAIHGTGVLEIQLRNLELLSSERAPRTGNVNVPVSVGTFTGGTILQREVNQGTLASPNWVEASGPDIPGWEAIESETLLVARRVFRALNITTVEGEDEDLELPALRSGYLVGGEDWAARPVTTTAEDWVASGDYDAAFVDTFITGRTAILRMEEVVPNSFDVARQRPIEFTVPAGIIISGLEWRYAVEDIDDEDWNQVARPAPNAPQTVNNQVQFVNNNTVRIMPNLQLHETGGYRTDTATIDIRFYVSVEAGYAARVTDELVVNIAGTGVSVLGTTGASEVIATIYDPVTIEHIGGAVNVHPVVGRENNIYHTDAGRIVITETEAGMLQEGTLLQVGIVQHYGIAQGQPLLLSRGHVLPSAAGDLSLLVVERIDPPTIGGQAVTWLTLQVMTESEEDGGPGTVVIDGLTLFGHVYQGEIYYLVVSGPAIAENHFQMGQVSWAWNPVATGIFITPPYYTEIIEFVAPDGEGAPDRRANSLAGVGFDSTRMANGTPEVLFERLPGMAHEGGFIQAREFAYAAGVDSSNVHWNGATGEAIIAGWDYQGNWLTVIMHRGSTSVTIIRGGEAAITGDIATIAPGTADPGTLAPIFRHNRIYLPARFLFNVFGYSADYNFERVGTRIVITPM